MPFVPPTRDERRHVSNQLGRGVQGLRIAVVEDDETTTYRVADTFEQAGNWMEM